MVGRGAHGISVPHTEEGQRSLPRHKTANFGLEYSSQNPPPAVLEGGIEEGRHQVHAVWSSLEGLGTVEMFNANRAWEKVRFKTTGPRVS